MHDGWLIGGGWQDQVGGLYGGFKLSSSAASLPLTVSIHPIPVLSSFIHTFNNHILLIHTGQSRLAKNLLQTVLRCWYQRDETVNNIIHTYSQFTIMRSPTHHPPWTQTLAPIHLFAVCDPIHVHDAII